PVLTRDPRGRPLDRARGLRGRDAGGALRDARRELPGVGPPGQARRDPPLSGASSRRRRQPAIVTFLRLGRWDWLAFVAALALLVTMSAGDWWTDKQGQECRRIERLQTRPPSTGPLGDQFGGDVRRAARECAEKHEKTAWQASALIDWIIKLVLAAAIAAAVAAAFRRAAGAPF